MRLDWACAAALVDSMVLTNRGQPELAESSGLRFKALYAFEFEGPRLSVGREEKIYRVSPSVR